jgi:hypothetical protein
VSRLVHSELHEDRPNVAVLIDVDRVMLPIGLNIHAEIDEDTPKIMHPEHPEHRVLSLPNQALVRIHKEIIDVMNDSGNEYVLILIMELEQSSVDT